MNSPPARAASSAANDGGLSAHMDAWFVGSKPAAGAASQASAGAQWQRTPAATSDGRISQGSYMSAQVAPAVPKPSVSDYTPSSSMGPPPLRLHPLLPHPVLAVSTVEVAVDGDQPGAGSAAGAAAAGSPRRSLLHVNADALRTVQSAMGDRLLRVVSIVGPYRSGKSFLLNRVLGRSSEEGGFGVSHRAQSSTKGLWMMPTLLQVEATEGILAHELAVLLVDTEGLGDPLAVDAASDVQRVLLTLLLSSHTLLNLTNVLNDGTLQMLAFVTELPQRMQFEAQQEQASAPQPAAAQTHASATASSPSVSPLSLLLPPLTFVIRDWTKSLEEFGHDADQYLASTLAEQAVPAGCQTAGAAIKSFNLVRSAVRSSFPALGCCTLPFPVLRPEDECQLLHSKAGVDRLTPKFIAAERACWRRVLTQLPEKMFAGVALSTASLIHCVQTLVDTLNDPAAQLSVPALGAAVAHVQMEPLRKAAEEAYCGSMDAMLRLPDIWPVYEKELQLLHERLLQESFDKHKPKLPHALHSQFKRSLQDSIAQARLLDVYRSRVADASRNQCHTAWGTDAAAFGARVTSGAFVDEAAYTRALTQLEVLVSQYSGPARPSYINLLQQRSVDWLRTVRTILMERNVTETETRAAEQRLRNEELKQKLQVQAKAAEEHRRAEEARLKQLALSKQKVDEDRRAALELAKKQAAERLREERRAHQARLHAEQEAFREEQYVARKEQEKRERAAGLRMPEAIDMIFTVIDHCAWGNASPGNRTDCEINIRERGIYHVSFRQHFPTCSRCGRSDSHWHDDRSGRTFTWDGGD
jgi:hypothetical protein